MVQEVRGYRHKHTELPTLLLMCFRVCCGKEAAPPSGREWRTPALLRCGVCINRSTKSRKQCRGSKPLLYCLLWTKVQSAKKRGRLRGMEGSSEKWWATSLQRQLEGGEGTGLGATVHASAEIVEMKRVGGCSCCHNR